MVDEAVPSLFDPPVRDVPVAVEARDTAINHVESRDCFDRAYLVAEAYVRMLRAGQTFTSEDVRDYLAVTDPILAAEVALEPRVLGAVMRTLGRRGVARATDRTVSVGRTSNHHRPQRVWVRLGPPSRRS